uniref:Uncharacterized protein n=1 Tax=Rhizophora mucronata TaxID=61149 RepID=A0A2P2N6E1_RHIMU
MLSSFTCENPCNRCCPKYPVPPTTSTLFFSISLYISLFCSVLLCLSRLKIPSG